MPRNDAHFDVISFLKLPIFSTQDDEIPNVITYSEHLRMLGTTNEEFLFPWRALRIRLRRSRENDCHCLIVMPIFTTRGDKDKSF